MIVNDSEKSLKVAQLFFCDYCHYNTSKKCDYIKHLSTDKHKNNENGSKMVVNDSEKSQKVANYECECGKIYKYDSGYYRHKKKCLGVSKPLIDDDEDPSDKELIMMLIKQNTQLIQQNAELVKTGTNNTTISNNSHNTNSHNKTFNLQFFLNETCKDAMNIMDFVDSIKLQLSDLENVGKMGFVDGISNIIVKSLNSLDETKRPVHCTDTKREVMYVKDENKWEKENDNKPKIRKLIKHVTHKNTKLIKDFKAKYPGCEKSESKYSNSYDKLVIEAFGGKGDNDEEKENKIIKKISNVTTIDKNV
jgi:hypothetical protein